LNDSPTGLAAWIIEKFRAWIDCNGDIELRFSKDELLTNIMIYWATDSIGSSFLPYCDYANASAVTWIKEGIKRWAEFSKVPAAFALFPADICCMAMDSPDRTGPRGILQLHPTGEPLRL